MKQLLITKIPIKVLRKNIKHLHICVYPPEGAVRISAPLRIKDEAIRLFAISKVSWIKTQKIKFTNQERQSEREYISGESHYFKGKRYLSDKKSFA